MRGDDGPQIWSIIAADGVDGFKDSDLHNRCKSRLGERVLVVRNGCVYRNYVPVQDGIGFCDDRPGQQNRHQHAQAESPLPRATMHPLHCASPRNLTASWSVMSGILAVESMVVHTEARV